MTNNLDRPCRILVVVRWPVGGIRTFLRYVYNNFDRHRYQFTILAPNGYEIRVLLHDLQGQDVTYKPTPISETLPSFFQSVAAEVFHGDYDIIHSHGLISGVCAAIPCFLRRVPHLLTIHDVFTKAQVRGIAGRIKLLAICANLVLVDAIHTVSHDAHANLLQYIPVLNLLQRKIHPIPNGIESSRFMGNEIRDLRGELGLSGDVFLIGFFGRFMSQKGFRYLVEALHLLKTSYAPRMRPVILTFGEGNFIREDADMVKEYGLENDVYFLPFTENIAPVLRGVNVVAMPSLWEACGLLAMEALVAGVPLIGSDCIGLREVIRDTPGMTVPMKNSQALAEALCREIDHPSMQRFEAFREEAARRFDVRKQSDALECLIAETIARFPRQ